MIDFFAKPGVDACLQETVQPVALHLEVRSILGPLHGLGEMNVFLSSLEGESSSRVIPWTLDPFRHFTNHNF